MKKKFSFILGVAVFLVLAGGSVGSNKDNVAVKDDKTTESTTAADTPTDAPVAEPEVKEYEISDVKTEKDSFATYIVGILQNNGDEKGYVQVTIPCYDKDGAKLGDALGNVNNIEKGGKWKFKAMYLGSETPDKCDVEKIEVTGF